MDLIKVLGELRAERERIDRAISALEDSSGSSSSRTGKASASRRKRGPMSAAARRKISVRMKQRWAERRKGRSAA